MIKIPAEAQSLNVYRKGIVLCHPPPFNVKLTKSQNNLFRITRPYLRTFLSMSLNTGVCQDSCRILLSS